MLRADGLLVDTHVLVWWQASSERLSAAVRDEMSSGERFAVSPISFWEIAMLERKRRIALDRPVVEWCTAVASDERVEVLPISPAIAAGAGTDVELHGDPADRLICATAMAHGLRLATKDGEIARFASDTRRLSVVW